MRFRIMEKEFSLEIGERYTDMQEKVKARLRESRLLAPSGRGGGEFTEPSLRLFLHVCSLVKSALTVTLFLSSVKGRDGRDNSPRDW